MLFGYASAALAGYVLTAIPKWTGRPPVSGSQLLGLVLLWLLGRFSMMWPGPSGVLGAALVDCVFLPTLTIIAGLEILSGGSWKNLKILAGLFGLSLANFAFHSSVILQGSATEASRAGVAIYVMLIVVVGGRMVPNYTRNWLTKGALKAVPVPFGRFDIIATAALVPTLLLWIAVPQGVLTASLAAAAAALHTFRLARWRGWLTIEEPLLLALHVGYAFVPTGLAAVAAAGMNWLPEASALHLLTVGAIGGMTLAIMTRASLGHTGRLLKASPLTALSYLALLISAVSRPFVEVLPSQNHVLLALAATGWLAAFGLFALEYGPMLFAPKR